MDLVQAIADVQDAIVAAVDFDGMALGYPIGGPKYKDVWLSDEVSELVPTYTMSTADGSPSGAGFKVSVKALASLQGSATAIRDELATLLMLVMAAILPDANGVYLSGAATRVEAERIQITPGLEDNTRFLGAEVTLAVTVGYE